MESVSFNGVVLTDRYAVLSNRGMASPTVIYDEVSGRDGVVVRGSVYGCPSVMLRVVVDPRDSETLADARRELAALLDVDGPRRLEFGGDGGLYYMAQPNGQLEWSQFVTTGRLDIPFLVPSPAMYGETRSVTVPSGGSVSFDVGGTYPTSPTINAPSAVRTSGDSGIWRVSLDGGDYVSVATGSSSPRAVVIDCEGRTCTVAGATALVTYDSDWLVLRPGSHTLRNSRGSGASTVTWTERWL